MFLSTHDEASSGMRVLFCLILSARGCGLPHQCVDCAPCNGSDVDDVACTQSCIISWMRPQSWAPGSPLSSACTPSASQLLPLPLLLCTACTTMKLFFNAGLHETNASSTFPSLHAMPMLASYVAWIQFDSWIQLNSIRFLPIFVCSMIRSQGP